MRALSLLVGSPVTIAQFARYVAIGSTVFCIDVGLFQVLVNLHALLPIAITVAYAVAIAAHFTLNKYLNFRAFDRSVQSQASTYLVVVFFLWLTTLAIVEAGVHAAHLMPLEAKIIAVAFNVPLGFLAHKHLTFGGGIFAGLRRLLARRQVIR